jgi:phospholipase A1
MKRLITLIILLISISAYAENSIQPYENSFIVTGFNKQNQMIINLSLKWGLIYPFETGLYLTYEQKSKWNIYDRSSPFMENNYSPGIIWQKDNILCLDFIRLIPYNHASNGMAGQESRSVDRGGLQIQKSWGDKFKFGINERYYYYYALSSKNHNYDHYIGLFKSQVFISIDSKYQYMDSLKLYIQGEWTHRAYWIESALMTNIITGKFSMKFFAYYRRGYAQWMANYKDKTEYFGIGLGLQ